MTICVIYLYIYIYAHLSPSPFVPFGPRPSPLLVAETMLLSLLPLCYYYHH